MPLDVLILQKRKGLNEKIQEAQVFQLFWLGISESSNKQSKCVTPPNVTLLWQVFQQKQLKKKRNWGKLNYLGDFCIPGQLNQVLHSEMVKRDHCCLLTQIIRVASPGKLLFFSSVASQDQLGTATWEREREHWWKQLWESVKYSKIEKVKHACFGKKSNIKK